MNPKLHEFALTPDRFTMLSGTVTRFADERVCIVQGTVWAGVMGVRVAAGEVQALVEETRRVIPAEKKTAWWIDPDVRPPDLLERLRALGFREPDDGHGIVHALACDTAPPAGANDVTVIRVDTFEDHAASIETMWDAFETPHDRRERERAHLREEFDAAQAAGTPITFLARVDGRPAGIGRSIYSDRGVFMIGGSVVEWARGRGVYRTLVRARWNDAAARGTPGLVTEALPDTSYPILKRLGFVDVGTLRRLEDPRPGA